VAINKFISLTIASIVLLTFLFINACQRQLHFDVLPADGTLSKDASGNCKPIIVGGTFTKGKSLADTNYVQVEVNVTTEGEYKLTSDTTNGYWFSASGNFDNTGLYNVKVIAHGKPVASGNDQFNIRFNSSSCSVVIPVADGGVGSFSFLGAPNSCTGAVVSGNYIKGVQLDNTNTAKVQVYVTSPGTYSFSSNVVNGYQFSSSGNLPNYGNQTLILTASGSPANVGIDVFTLNAGFSSCTIVDTVKDAAPVTNGTHFPIKYSDRWVYDDVQSAGDSVVRVIADSINIGGALYKVMNEADRFGSRDYHYRQNGTDYLDQGAVDRYTSSFSYSPKIIDEIPFLKEGLNVNDSWNSPTYTGVATFGQTILIRYQFVCTNNNASVVINGTMFNQVYQIQMRPQIASVGGTYGYTGEVYDLYYANNIGLIYLRENVNSLTQKEWKLRSWIVN
jgi:hypothetical protein